MGVTVPDNVKVLTTEFKDHYQSLCLEVERLSKIATDLERIRMQTMKTPIAGFGSIRFFRITSLAACEWTPTSYSGCGEPFTAHGYVGEIFQMKPGPSGDEGNLCKESGGTGAFGYDLSVIENTPCRMPDGASVFPQPLHKDRVVMGVLVAKNTVVFCSNMPRLGAECGEPTP